LRLRKRVIQITESFHGLFRIKNFIVQGEKEEGRLSQREICRGTVFDPTEALSGQKFYPYSKLTLGDLMNGLTYSKSANFIRLPVPFIQLYLHLNVGMPAFLLYQSKKEKM